MNGFAIIDKPQGWTSHDVVAKMRGVLGTRKIGHAGTLDPMATGVLPLLVGTATRALDYLPGGKEYIASFRVGLETDTQDITGEVTATSRLRPALGEVEAALAAFVGDIMQVPPMYSAVKINGRRLYKAARAGEVVERPARAVTVSRLALLEASCDEYTVEVACSAGTYIRTLCHDVGRRLGCGAVLTALRRTMACGFAIESAATLERWQDEPKPALLPVDTAFEQYLAVTVGYESELRLRNGAQVKADADGLVRVYGESDTFLMLGRAGGGRLKVEKQF